MHKKKPSSNDDLWFGEWQLGRINIDRKNYERLLEETVLEIQRQHGLHSGPPCFYRGRPPSLTQAMTRLIEGFKLALFCELADIPPQRLPSNLLPVLVEQVPEKNFRMSSLPCGPPHSACTRRTPATR